MWRIWVAALFWGLNWPAVKIILASISPWTLRAVGLSGGALLLAGAARWMAGSLAVPRSAWRHLAVASLLNVVGFNLFAVFAQLNLPTSRAAILTFTMPLWAAFVSWLWLSERIDRLRALALAIGTAGLAVLASPFLPVVRDGGLPVGLLYALGASITWALGTVYLKRHPIPADPLVATAWQVILAAVVLCLGTLAFETPRIDLSSPLVAGALAFHIALPQAVSYALWFSLIRTVSAGTAALGTLLIPIFGVSGAVLVLGEQPSAIDLAGFALLLASVVVDQIVREFAARRARKGVGQR